MSSSNSTREIWPAKYWLNVSQYTPALCPNAAVSSFRNEAVGLVIAYGDDKVVGGRQGDVVAVHMNKCQ